MELIQRIKEETVEKLFQVQMARPAEVDRFEAKKEKPLVLSRGGEEAAKKQAPPVKRETRKVGRNEPCPCGSGKKYKKCCGK
jgi:preprotein translocase subunit SecA